jgi:hypothetical protein
VHMQYVFGLLLRAGYLGAVLLLLSRNERKHVSPPLRSRRLRPEAALMWYSISRRSADLQWDLLELSQGSALD